MPDREPFLAASFPLLTINVREQPNVVQNLNVMPSKREAQPRAFAVGS